MRAMRRSVLLGALAWGGTVLLGAGLPRPLRASERLASRVEWRLARIFRASAGAREIGAAYLRSRPTEADRGALVMLLANQPGDLARWRVTGTRALRQDLAIRCCDDFARGRIVAIRGWVLSQTEARLCALATLGRGAAGTGTNQSAAALPVPLI